MKRFAPQVPDPYINQKVARQGGQNSYAGDMKLAQFGHLNGILDLLYPFNTGQDVTAHAGGGQTLAVPLIIGFNLVTTATTGDSVQLPVIDSAPCSNCENESKRIDPIAPIVIKNLGTASLDIYPPLGAQIDALGVNAPFILASGASISFAQPLNVYEGASCNKLNVKNCNQWTSYGCCAGEEGGVCTDGVTITGTGLSGSCLSVVPSTPLIQSAEFVQLTQSPNNSVASGNAFEFLTDNPTGIYNNIVGLRYNNTGPGAQGTVFFVPAGAYMIDWGMNLSSTGPISLYTGTVLGTYAIDNNSTVGSTTATTWLHGRSIINAAVGTYFYVGASVSTAAVAKAGTSAPYYNVSLTIQKIK